MRNINNDNAQFGILDLLQIMSLYLSIRSYNESVSQGQMHDIVNEEVEKVREHLTKQDGKIDKILELLGKIGGEDING